MITLVNGATVLRGVVNMELRIPRGYVLAVHPDHDGFVVWEINFHDEWLACSGAYFSPSERRHADNEFIRLVDRDDDVMWRWKP